MKDDFERQCWGLISPEQRLVVVPCGAGFAAFAIGDNPEIGDDIAGGYAHGQPIPRCSRKRETNG